MVWRSVSQKENSSKSKEAVARQFSVGECSVSAGGSQIECAALESSNTPHRTDMTGVSGGKLSSELSARYAHALGLLRMPKMLTISF